MNSEFNYSISTQTLNGAVNLERLINEYEELDLDENLLQIVSDKDKLIFVFSTPMNNEIVADSALDSLVANHNGLEVSKAKILRYSPEGLDKPIYSLNFRKELNTRLHNDSHWVFGRLLRERFYPFNSDLKTVNYDDLVIEIIYDYEFNDTTKEADYRLEIIKWFDEDGEVIEKKSLPKKYLGHEGMAEAERRRKNIINFLKHDLDSFSKSGESDNSQAVAELIAQIKDYVSLYVEYGSFAIITVLDSLNAPLLDGVLAPNYTVRDHMKAKLNFLVYEELNQDLYKGSML